MFTLKLLAMALLILSGSYALAANNAAIQTQDGNYNDTLLEQAGEGNNAAQIQRGDFSRSEVVQTGNGNSAQIEQESQASTPENSLRLEQIGNQNTALLNQQNLGYGHQATVLQRGDGNDITLYQQDGNGSVASLYQEGNRNIHNIQQLRYGNELSVTSVGNGNSATTTQYGGGPAHAEQRGEGNSVELTQSVGYAGGNIEVYQEGTNQAATLYQTSSRYGQIDLILNQVGDGNTANLAQRSDMATLEFVQDGTGNDLVADQGIWRGSLGGAMVGNGNVIEASQVGTYLNAWLEQNGDNNRIAVSQRGLGHTASVRQTGTGNETAITQDDYVSDYEPNSSAYVLQEGEANSAVLNQSFGPLARGFIEQAGAANQATIDHSNIEGWTTAGIQQTGDNHKASITQHDTVGFDEATITQQVAGNVASITQGGLLNGEVVVGERVATISQTGMNNVASVIQQ